MFSIDKTIRITFNEKTGETTTSNFKLKNEFDLQNLDTYDLKGNVIKFEDQWKYDFEMSIKLERTYPYYKCADLLDYHFTKTKDKNLFLKHIKHVLLFKWNKEQPEKRKFIDEWINEKLGTNTNNKFKYFEKYFDQYSNLNVYKNHYLHQFKKPTVEFNKAIEPERQILRDIAEKFISEINNNLFDIESKEKIKRYIEQIQSKLNLIYEYIESDSNNYILLESSVPTIQNLIRDYALKNDIQIIGDEIMNNKKNENTIPNIEIQKDDFNPSFWNEKTYKLFDYLTENYLKKGNIKYINIYYFIRDISIVNNSDYRFDIIIDEYKKIILDKFDIEIKKFAKAEFDYQDKQLPKLKDLEIKYRQSYK